MNEHDLKITIEATLLAAGRPLTLERIGVLFAAKGGGPDRTTLKRVIDTLAALSSMRDDRALPQIAALAKKKRWLAWGKTSQMRQACVQTLHKIGTAKARQTIADLAATGDFFLKRLAKTAGRPA